MSIIHKGNGCVTVFHACTLGRDSALAVFATVTTHEILNYSCDEFPFHIFEPCHNDVGQNDAASFQHLDELYKTGPILTRRKSEPRCRRRKLAEGRISGRFREKGFEQARAGWMVTATTRRRNLGRVRRRRNIRRLDFRVTVEMAGCDDGRLN
jgi:hypothetical protein